MSKPKNSNLTTLSVALVLCLVCSVMVSAVAVGLKPEQIKNSELDRNKNVLIAAQMANADVSNADVANMFKEFEVKLVNMQTGKYATEDELKAEGVDPATYDMERASKNPALSIALGDNDPARIGRKAKFATVYVLNNAQNRPELIVLPIKGYGLWGTIYGFLALDSDLNTIKGISFYQHKETPGLGARIEEADWRAKWQGIKSYDDQGQVATGVTKAGNHKENYVDGISGATLTGRGVNNLIQFWLGEDGYKPFLDNLRNGKEG